MVMLLVRYGMIGAGVAVTGFYGTVLLNYAFEILQQFAMMLVVVIGFWVAGLIFLANFLTSQSNLVLRGIGEVFSGMMMYTALFQGILYTALLFMVVGTVGGFGELADSSSGLIYDMVFGMGYLSVLIYGSAGMVILTTYYRPQTRILGISFGILNVVITLFLLLTQAENLREFAETNLTVFTAGSVAYLLVWSVLFMVILGQVEDDSYQKKAELKRRLKSRQQNRSE